MSLGNKLLIIGIVILVLVVPTVALAQGGTASSYFNAQNNSGESGRVGVMQVVTGTVTVTATVAVATPTLAATRIVTVTTPTVAITTPTVAATRTITATSVVTGTSAQVATPTATTVPPAALPVTGGSSTELIGYLGILGMLMVLAGLVMRRRPD